MKELKSYSGLYTDHYELTMAQAYLLNGKKDTPVCFDYFFRKTPFKGAYAVFCGLEESLHAVQHLRFEGEEIEYLQSLGFHKEFLQYLKNFTFKGSIHAVKEGEIIFPNEPIVRVEGNIIECQLLETLLLNILNFESLIATKASRIRNVSRNKTLIDFGLRRAQGLGGIQASRAAIIGGFNSTSNEYSACEFHLHSAGTMAHSFIQSYDSQIEAFRAFATTYPEASSFLVDTYNTLQSGIPDAITVAKEMEAHGHRLISIRLDSGDLAYLSKKARHMLDEAGLQYVKIIASNQLDEFVIKNLLEQDAPIDAFGVGTSLVTGQPDAALDGVYKLSMADNKARLKLSEDKSKIILPGIKKVIRFIDESNMFCADGIALQEEENIERLINQHHAEVCYNIRGYKEEELLIPVMHKGEVISESQAVSVISEYSTYRRQQLPNEYKKFEKATEYKVGVSTKLIQLRDDLIYQLQKR